MKNSLLYCTLVGTLLSFSSCTDAVEDFTGEGKLMLNASVNSEVKLSRASDTDELNNELGESLIVWIKNSKKELVRKFNGISSLPVSGETLLSDHYTAYAWAGDSVPASWDKRWFRAEPQDFAITNDNTAEVSLVCKITNAVVTAKFDESLEGYVSDYQLVVSQAYDSKWALTYTENKSGYFTIPSKCQTLNYTFTGKSSKGTISKTGTIDIQRAYEYVIEISSKIDEEDYNDGGAFIKIEVSEDAIEEDKEIQISIPPLLEYRVTGVAMVPINEPLVAKAKEVGNPVISAAGYAPLKNFEIKSSLFKGYFSDQEKESFDALNMNTDATNILYNKGIFVKKYLLNGEETTNGSYQIYRCLISLTQEFTEKLTEIGDYTFTVKATDVDGKSSEGTFTISITNDPMVLSKNVEIAELTWEGTKTISSATVSGSLLESVNSIQVQYRLASESQWSTFDVQPANGSAFVEDEDFKAHLTDLKFSSDYEYQMYVVRSDGSTWTSPTQYFTTPTPPQLPNAGFEDWQTSSSPYLIYRSGEDMFWDSGNHGSALLKKNVTVPDSDVKHSGKYSVKLESQFVAFMGIGKFAAGNVFIGKYIDTDGTDGIIGFGRSFTGRPKALKGYVRYEPGTVEYTNSRAPDIVNGQPDKGIIYMALLDNTTDEEYPEFPVVVKTKTQQLFNKNASNVIAYGELVFGVATEGNGLVKFTIDFDYKRTDIIPSFIMITAAASKGGDYFAGGPSKMWLDDFELVYE